MRPGFVGPILEAWTFGDLARVPSSTRSRNYLGAFRLPYPRLRDGGRQQKLRLSILVGNLLDLVAMTYLYDYESHFVLPSIRPFNGPSIRP